MRRIALIGAGYIADIHAEVLKALEGLEVTAVVDPSMGRAQALAEKWGIPDVYDDLANFLAEGTCDHAHILVPPPLHRSVAESVLSAGISAFLEKPMAESADDCLAIQETARAADVRLGVNQNFVHHPVHAKARSLLQEGRLGPLRHVVCRYMVPLRQLAAGQFGHWMFDSPRNLLLEQAVHPLSQIVDLAGPAREVRVRSGKPRSVGDGIEIVNAWVVSLECERAAVQLQIVLGHSYPVWSITATCDDGQFEADYVRGRLVEQSPTRWMEFYDAYLTGLSAASQTLRQSHGNAFDYILSTTKLKPRTDNFFRSMRESIAEYYKAQSGGADRDKSGFASSLVSICEQIAADSEKPKSRPNVRVSEPNQSGACDVLVLGGTGFIGTHLVRLLSAQNRTITVMARNVRNLPAPFADDKVTVVSGDITDRDRLLPLVKRAKVVVNLAHGGAGGDWSAVERAMVGGARTVAECCLSAGTERLVFVSSIAALYLGEPNASVTSATSPDPKPERRNSYARGKAVTESTLLAMARTEGLPVVILRPGVVVGDGTSPFHSGIGLYNSERHCLGWNRGLNPLPLVLVEDVATAIISAIDAPDCIGKTFNVVGDVRLSAREYVAALAKATRRPLRYYPQSLLQQQAVEIFKWLVKRASGRRDAPLPSYADLKSRGLISTFDTSEEKRILGWQPVADRGEFLRRAFPVDAR